MNRDNFLCCITVWQASNLRPGQWISQLGGQKQENKVPFLTVPTVLYYCSGGVTAANELAAKDPARSRQMLPIK